MKTDGSIIIGTKVDNSGLKKDLKTTENLLNQFDDKNEITPEVNTDEFKSSIDDMEEAFRKFGEETEKEKITPTMNSDEILKEINKVGKELEKLDNKTGKDRVVDGVKITGLQDDSNVEQYNKMVDKMKELQDQYRAAIEYENQKAKEIEKQNMLLERQGEEVKNIYDFYKTEPEPVMEPEIDIPDENVDIAMQKLQQQLNKAKLDIMTTQGNIQAEELNVKLIEDRINAIMSENGALLNQYTEYQNLLSLKEKGYQLTEKEKDILETASLIDLEGSFQEINTELDEQIGKQQQSVFKIDELNQKLELQKLKYAEITRKVKEKNEAEAKTTTNYDSILKGIDGASNKMSGVIKKVGRWGLAIMGVRTAISLVTRAFSTLSQYNSELADKISNIRLVLAVALEPIITRILSLVITLLGYLNYLTKAWFGLDLFARASELSTKKMAENVSAGASAAEDMKKQLAGFDEMNVIQDTQSGGGGGGAGGGSKTPEFNLPEGEVPEWLKWIKDHGAELLAIFAGIIAFIVALKLGLGIIKGLGIGLLIAGIVYAIMGLIAYLKDPSWENFGKILIGIGIALIGLAILIGNIPLAIAGAIVLIIGLLVKNWDKIKAWIQGIADWFHNKAEEFKKKGQGFVGGIFEFISTEIEEFIKFFELVINSVKRIFDGIIKFIKGVFKGDWKMAWEGIKDIFGGIFDLIVGIAKQTLERILNFIKTIGASISSVISSIVNWIKDKFNIVINFFKGVGIAIGDFFSSAIKGAVNGVLSWVESKVNWFIDKINSVIGLINKIPGVSIGKLSRISLPRLATGAIINQPGRGVPVGNAIVGEAGREGILPLTDRSAMEMLGREIGKWITLNANIPVSIGNRQIAREVRKLMAQDDFAMNN